MRVVSGYGDIEVGAPSTKLCSQKATIIATDHQPAVD